MSKKACVIISDGVEEIELGIIVNIFDKGEIETTIASSQDKHLVNGSRSVQIQANKTLEEVKDVSNQMILTNLYCILVHRSCLMLLFYLVVTFAQKSWRNQ